MHSFSNIIAFLPTWISKFYQTKLLNSSSFTYARQEEEILNNILVLINIYWKKKQWDDNTTWQHKSADQRLYTIICRADLLEIMWFYKRLYSAMAS